jgi:hypothetical protein
LSSLPAFNFFPSRYGNSHSKIQGGYFLSYCTFYFLQNYSFENLYVITLAIWGNYFISVKTSLHFFENVQLVYPDEVPSKEHMVEKGRCFKNGKPGVFNAFVLLFSPEI